MASISESFEHRKIRDTQESLMQDARDEWNSDGRKTTHRVASLIGVSGDKKEIVDPVGLRVRILTKSLTRAERFKVREMAGVSKKK